MNNIIISTYNNTTKLLVQKFGLILLICSLFVISVSSVDVPTSPFLDLTVISDSSIKASISPPLSDGGASINSYKIDWDSDPGKHEIQTIQTSTYLGANEIQSITTSALIRPEIQTITTSTQQVQEEQKITVTADGGTYFIEFDTSPQGGSLQYSGDLSFNFPASGTLDGNNVADTLSSMSNIKPFGSVTVTLVTTGNTRDYTVTFPASMGNVPTMVIHPTSLTPSGTASASIGVVKDGNVLGGTFRLTFRNQTTGNIPYDASEQQMRVALERLSTVGTVAVSRGLVTNQRGYSWVVTFSSPLNSGNVPAMLPDSSSLTVSTTQISVQPSISITSQDGNELGGTFTVSYKPLGAATPTVSGNIPFDASPLTFKSALESMSNNVFPAGTISVSRTGPDGQKGYSWTVTFLQDYARTHEGSLNYFQYSVASLSGSTPLISIAKVRDGTFKHIKKLDITSMINPQPSGWLSDNALLSLQIVEGGVNYYAPNISFVTSTSPYQTICDGPQPEVQYIDTTAPTGDYKVSQFLQLKLRYLTQETPWIYANKTTSNGCTIAAAEIGRQLSKFPSFNQVTVTATATEGTTTTINSNSVVIPANSQTCKWAVTFTGAIGNIPLLQVQAYNYVTLAKGSYGVSSTAGDDVIYVSAGTDGTINAIKYALEQMPITGKVTVTSTTSLTTGINSYCAWLITFDTKAGSTSISLNAKVNPTSNQYGTTATASGSTFSTRYGFKIVDAQTKAANNLGNSIVLGGYFALSFRGARTAYLPFDSDQGTVKWYLETLDTIGKVDVSRSVKDENGGYTWSVTFLTELGNLDSIIIDVTDMTGTAITGTVQEFVVGVAPPFNSLDVINGLPLGSAVITDLTNPAITVSDLEEGIAYFFRVAAVNSIGQGSYAFSSTPYAIPQAQRPSLPLNASLAVLDGKSAVVNFNPPMLDGGRDVTFFKIEYGNNPFVSEIQSVALTTTVVPEIQIVKTTTDHTGYEVQLVYISVTNGAAIYEVQQVQCSASGGSFTLSFNGYSTAPIDYDATITDITNALQALANINTVTVTFDGSSTKACAPKTTFTNSFKVTFNSVVDMAGNLPLMTYGSNSLTGISKFIQITETIKGAAPIGGTFRLSFKGSMTDDIPVDASTNPTTLASNMDTKLELLDTIPSGGVTVSASIVSTNNVLYKVTFTHSDLGGDVEALQVVPAFNKLTGTDIAIVVATDGALAGGAPSTRGNELSGSFQLSFRNYKTPPISFDAADTELKAMLETLPNIGTVVVTRTGPTSWKEYVWTITFLSTPGFFPIGSGDLPMMTSVITSLVGTTAAASICPVGTTCRDGSKPFGGYFSLTLNTQTTANIAASATESEMTSALNALSTIGTVSVSRKVLSNGLKWYITFDGCKIYNGGDVCNVGNVNYLTYTDISLSSSMTSPSLSVTEEIRGVGPGSCVGSNTGLCVSNMTDLSGSSPYSFVINNLNTGNPYYVRVAAHNSIGFGYSAIPVPNFVVPTFNPPGAPPPVRLVSSATTSITVEWSLPRENGGSIVDGYELWMDDWSGGNSRLVFDGTGQPTVLQFTISTSTSLVITSGKSYRFTVRAVNYCIATDLNKLCYGEFSEPAVFTARAPRAPLPPPMPYRTSATDTEILSGTATTIAIRWNAPIDNGGALLTNYYVNYAAPSDVTYTQVALSAASAKLDTTNGALVLQYKLTITQTPPPLGNVYRFYIVAENSIGRSPASPILSVVLGKLPGFDMYTSYPHTLTYASNSPLISSVDSTSISLNWPIPAYNALGGNPITGYKVYMLLVLV